MGRLFFLALVGLLAHSAPGFGRPEPAAVFQDAMVLQRSVPVPVWGTAAPGEEVAVEFAGQRKVGRSDAKGNWAVKLDPLAAAAEGRDLTITAGRPVRLRDVVVGEVWVAAGQSNMEWPLAKEAHAAAELPRADLPAVRLLNLAYAGQNFFAKPFDRDVLSRLTPGGYFRGAWRPCSPASAGEFSAIGYYFAKEVQKTVGVPVGVIHLAVGGSPTEAWVRPGALAGDDTLRPLLAGNWLENKALAGWCRQRALENLGPAPGGGGADATGPNHPFKPGFLWDAGVARLIPFPVRGVLWYQGESNALDADRVRQHDRLFRILVADWRRQWGLGDFPFLFCQLSSVGTGGGYKSHYWPEFRDAQRRALADIPNAGMVVTSDLGHPTDVHPRNKRDVGHRLTLCAAAQVYGKKIPFSGPLVKSARRERSTLVVTFDHADGGLKTRADEPATGFEVAGPDGAFRPAEVALAGDTVSLSVGGLDAPTAARYGWQPYSRGNLTNGAGLPASTFVTTAAPK
ncbi:sialate O-acetylesterase [Fimbriiglobus ruber]|uniref:Sialic acid-specific 9-O-acetylesterase n=1 Tax=Fimbriiglobus ruber TaxID=1908690 RepID=A0A225DGG7_9BACT|nr:sialate O-acetylesterase [Fimbriiglobus ruber]OWK37618.1 Sialic acid-specific 9-O-acetylesterase [Fimbriiglobus ruber]